MRNVDNLVKFRKKVDPFSVKDITFTVMTEDGETRLKLNEYHARDDLMKKVGLVTTPTDGRQTVFMGNTIISYPVDYLEDNPKKKALFLELDDIVRKNPLKYFIPQNDAALQFINDSDHNLKGFIAGNGGGKTTCAWIDVLLDIVPCDPSWPIFTQYGIKHRRYKGPKTMGGVGVVSYEWANHISTIWPQVIKRWTPLESLGGYAEGGPLVINWKNNPKLEIDGTPVMFFACSQAQTVFESSALDIYFWDEQGEEDKFNGANMRVRRRNGRHVFALTPHRVIGRPDTGANSWIHKLYKGETTAGLKCKFYTGDIFDIPDWIYSEESKKSAYREWVTEPTQNNDLKKLREGRSRIYGEFHEASGLVFDEWNPEYHLIDPFEIPETWTRYRAIDHGRVNPTAALLAAVDPDGNVYLYDEYYQVDKVVSENVPAIIRMCGNDRRKIGFEVDARGIKFDRWEEFGPVTFRKTILDPRSMAKKGDETSLTIGDLYRLNGLRCTPATGLPFEHTLPTAKEFLRLDFDKEHKFLGRNGAPRCYVFRTMTNFISEINKFVNEEVIRASRDGSRTVSERPRGKDDHLMTCFVWLCTEGMRYYHDFDIDLLSGSDIKQSRELTRDPYTGY